MKSPPKFIFCTKIILTSYKYDAVRVYFEPSIQSLKVRENLDHLKVNKEKEIEGREILFYIIFNYSLLFKTSWVLQTPLRCLDIH